MPSELPEVPWRVLARTSFNGRAQPQWRHLIHGNTFRTIQGAQVYVGYMEVIDHPRNDPEAIKIIEDAKQEATDAK